jgi:hypothetical protein
MSTVSITQPRTWYPTLILLVFAPLFVLHALPVSTASKTQVAVAAGFLCLPLFYLWVELVRGCRTVRIELDHGTVSVSSLSPFFRSRLVTYQLSEFGSVFSYITVSRFSTNRVELAHSTGGKSLLLAEFETKLSSRSFWSAPTEVESLRAVELRTSVATTAHLKDAGFLGSRARGKQL